PGRPAPVEQRASVAEQAETAEAVAVASGLNPLLVAANRLLNVLPQLRSSVQHPNPIALRDSLAQGIRQFESQARAAGVPTEKVVAARYALCTLIDETATSTPLGASGAWAQQGLLALFHGEVGGGEKFFQLMARLAENPQANQDLIELMYVCLEFGFEGRYRVTEGGQRQLEAIRQRLLMIVRKQRGDYERDLSPNWRGVSAANQRRLGSVPLWVVGAVAGLLLVAIYVGFEWPLSRTSDKLAADIAALRVAAPVPPRPAAAPRLAAFLAEEVKRGLVKVDDNADRSVVTIPGISPATGEEIPSPPRRTTRPKVARRTVAWKSRCTFPPARRRPRRRRPAGREDHRLDPQADLQSLGAARRRDPGAGAPRVVDRPDDLDQQLPSVRAGVGSLDPDRVHRADAGCAVGLAAHQGQARQRRVDHRAPSAACRGGSPLRVGGGGQAAPPALRGGAGSAEKAPVRRRPPVALDADPLARLAAISLQPALVRLHRSPGRRQDNGAGQLGPALPARGSSRPRGGPGCRRHAKLRLV